MSETYQEVEKERNALRIKNARLRAVILDTAKWIGTRGWITHDINGDGVRFDQIQKRDYRDKAAELKRIVRDTENE